MVIMMRQHQDPAEELIRLQSQVALQQSLSQSIYILKLWGDSGFMQRHQASQHGLPVPQTSGPPGSPQSPPGLTSPHISQDPNQPARQPLALSLSSCPCRGARERESIASFLPQALSLAFPSYLITKDSHMKNKSSFLWGPSAPTTHLHMKDPCS